MTKISEDDVLAFVQELGSDLEEGQLLPQAGDLILGIREMEELDLKAFREAIGEPFTDILGSLVDKQYITRTWDKGAYRYAVTKKGDQRIKKVYG